MAYTKVGPFTNGSNTPAITATFLNGIETALVTATSPAALAPPAPSGGDDTAALNAWAASVGAGVGTLLPATYITTGITLPAGMTLYGYGAVLKGSAAGGNIITLNTKSRVYGVEIDGSAVTSSTSSGIATPQNVYQNVVQDCRIHDVKNTGINFDHAFDFRIVGNVIGLCGSGSGSGNNGIGVTFSSGGIISNNTMRNNGGIECWGGDAANPGSGIYGTTNIVASNNSVKSGGGIFFASVQYFTITGNTVDTAPDVGIDLEGCADGAVTGNEVKDCVNGCYSLFFASKNINFTGNRATNTLTTGRGAALGIFSTGFTSSGIVISGNAFTSAMYGITTDNSTLGDSIITGNTVVITTGNGYPILLQQSYNVIVSDNQCAGAATRGISLEGSYDCTVAGNRVLHAGSDTTSLGSNAGVWIYNRSTSWPGNHNVVRGNKIAGFTTGIADYGNANIIENNSVDTIWHNQSGGGYVTYIGGNRTLANPTVLAAVTAVA